jgi:cytochrome P460
MHLVVHFGTEKQYQRPGRYVMRMLGVRFGLPVVVLLFGVAMLSAQEKQDKYELKEPNGVSFSEIRGYETWQAVAPSYRTDKNEVRIILGNDTLVKAYKDGVPENGKPFPDGSVLVKLGYSERKSAAFPAAIEPDVFQRVEFMIKDAKRFKSTNGWGYARFIYDAKTKTFSAYGKEAAFDQECNACHTIVKAQDFVFTRYAPR